MSVLLLWTRELFLIWRQNVSLIKPLFEILFEQKYLLDSAKLCGKYFHKDMPKTLSPSPAHFVFGYHITFG